MSLKVFRWILIKISAFAWLDISARADISCLLSEGQVTLSLFLVYRTLKPLFSKIEPSFKEISNVTSFSFVPITPIEPESYPPWPASMRIVSTSFEFVFAIELTIEPNSSDSPVFSLVI